MTEIKLVYHFKNKISINKPNLRVVAAVLPVVIAVIIPAVALSFAAAYPVEADKKRYLTFKHKICFTFLEKKYTKITS
jgi:hypothetical protein